jgi:protein associated with RNAse G/E
VVQDYDRPNNTNRPRKATYTEDRWFNPIRVMFGKELSEGFLIYIDTVLALPVEHQIVAQILRKLSENTLMEED